MPLVDMPERELLLKSFIVRQAVDAGTADDVHPYEALEAPRVTSRTVGGRMLADLRDALRQLRKAPGFTTTAFDHAGTGDRSDDRDLYAGAPGDAEVAAGDQAGVSLWRIGDKDRCCNWGGYTQGGRRGFYACSRGRRTRTFARTRPSSRTWRRCRPAMRRLASAERDRRLRPTRATGSMCPEISSGPLACSRGLAA